MSEAERAWVLWNLLRECGDALWDRYESAFLEFCNDDCDEPSRTRLRRDGQKEDLPF